MGGPPAGGAPGPVGPPNPAQTPAIILGVCALLIAVGVFTKSWVSASERKVEVGVGLLGAKACFGSECRSMSWDDMGGKVPGDIKAFGYLGLITGLGAIGGAGFCAFLAFQRQSHKIPVKPIQGVFGAAAFSFTYFLVRVMTDDVGDKGGISYSGILAIVGVVGATFVLKQMLMPIIRQGAPAGLPVAYAAAAPMAAAPAGVAPTVACPRCNGPAAYVAQYQRHFCNACQQYV